MGFTVMIATRNILGIELVPSGRVGRSFVEPKSTQNLSKLTSTVLESFASRVPDELSQPSWTDGNLLESHKRHTDNHRHRKSC